MAEKIDDIYKRVSLWFHWGEIKITLLLGVVYDSPQIERLARGQPNAGMIHLRNPVTSVHLHDFVGSFEWKKVGNKMSPCRLSRWWQFQIFVSSIGGPNPFLSRWWFPTQTCFYFHPEIWGTLNPF